MSTTFNTKCLPGMAPSAPAGTSRGPLRAHTLLRRPAQPARAWLEAPRLTSAVVEYREAPEQAADSGQDQINHGLGRPRVLHVDTDSAIAGILSSLVVPEAHVVHAPTLAAARQLLQSQVFSLVILDPALPDGDARTLLPMLGGTPLLVYAAHQPEWRGASPAYLPKPWTSSRQLWTTISGLLGLPGFLTAGD